jgi:hypothetical protein
MKDTILTIGETYLVRTTQGYCEARLNDIRGTYSALAMKVTTRYYCTILGTGRQIVLKSSEKFIRKI